MVKVGIQAQYPSKEEAEEARDMLIDKGVPWDVVDTVNSIRDETANLEMLASTPEKAKKVEKWLRENSNPDYVALQDKSNL